MSHVFISYNQEDGDFAAVMMTTLEKAGFDTWLDKGRLRVGSDWSDEIDRAILSAFAVVLIMSPDSRASEYVTYEWSFALGAGVPLVPVLRRETEIHPRLQRIQYLDFRGTVRPWEDLMCELTSLRSAKTTYWRPPRDAPSFVQRAFNDLDSGDVQTRQGALGVLATSNHSAARDTLRYALTHSFHDIRISAAHHLVQLKDEVMMLTQLDTFLEVLKKELFWVLTSENNRRLAHEVLGLLTTIGRPAYKIILEASKSNNALSIMAFEDLGDCGGEEAIPDLIESLKNPDREIVRSAVRQLGKLQARQARDVLTDMLQKDIDNGTVILSRFNIHSEILIALAKMGDFSFLSFLKGLDEQKYKIVADIIDEILMYKNLREEQSP